ncbi:uncharacterized protein LOC103313907 isoform X2 [Tribolium castaneum]|uniref:uncharacterized protein LOC103313907 isoform X2 n=1 Tax=Tribolium castaneum TaxID=7070 RepID=UPI00046BF1BF|nr:PREDICTED: uncharacterized protein LOC103313907 isoform X2 [Tribolium castaneum]|eukprot:XP_008196619.1 PREDICTED: uncharacterized protein LOC103313907 isoform X2 [Tribolium castaneum]
MSVSDPLIKDIKGHTLRLFHETTVKDSSENLEKFCQVIETIFHKGLIEKHNFYSKKIEVFAWMSTISSGDELIDFIYQNSVQEVQKCKSVKTPIGKFRLLIRYCLVNKCLHFPLEALNKSDKKPYIYERNSIIGDEILSTILLSVLLQCKKINFQLDLFNYYFLDLTWGIPDRVKLELVPCQSLGINISFSENRAVIVHIRPNSVASESGEITVGDILANLNDVEINSSCKGRLNTILRLSKGRPINLIIIKASHNNDIFAPFKTILRDLKLGANHEQTPRQNEPKSGFKAAYLGCVSVGCKGSVKQIEEALKFHLNKFEINDRKPVSIEIGEINVKILLETGEILFKHSFMQISSCGSAPNLPNYVAYIAGEENCDTANNFVCYIFYVHDVSLAYTILQSIGQGFYRTHFAV